MKPRHILVALLNFFLMGPGYILNGKRLKLGVALTLGSIGLTYVELSIKEISPELYWIMFASVFIINTFLAIDGYVEAKSLDKKP